MARTRSRVEEARSQAAGGAGRVVVLQLPLPHPERLAVVVHLAEDQIEGVLLDVRDVHMAHVGDRALAVVGVQDRCQAPQVADAEGRTLLAQGGGQLQLNRGFTLDLGERWEGCKAKVRRLP